MNQTKEPLFLSGQLYMSHGVLEQFGEMKLAIFPMIQRHLKGDWGEINQEDKQANDAAVKNGNRILSCYTVLGTKLWIITEADRSATTVLLPSEY